MPLGTFGATSPCRTPDKPAAARIGFRLLCVLAALRFSHLPAAARDLTFEERVKAQEAIERVYYAHQIGATKPFEEAVPRAVLERRVRTYLKQSVALEQFWKTPVTPDMLRSELARMAGGTRMPERLLQLYTALGNDSFLIRECLARPALVDRLARNFLAFDSRLHAASRDSAMVLRESLAQGSIDPLMDHAGRSVLEIRRLESAEGTGGLGSEAGSFADANRDPIRIDLASEEFERYRSTLPEQPREIGPLEETRDAFVIRVTLNAEADRMRVATYAVPKVSWDEWWGSVESGLQEASVGTVAMAEDPIPMPPSAMAGLASDRTCVAEAWDNRSLDDFPYRRVGHTAVWTGSVMIVWGGGDGYGPFDSGGRYDPATDTWSATTRAHSPLPRYWHTAVWTGSVMIVWGGWDGASLGTGGRYDPVSDTWSPVSTVDAPASSGRSVWTGREMIVWAGTASGSARYDPVADAWSSITAANAPCGGVVVIWTGSVMVVWGDGCAGFPAAGRYDPFTDSWTPASTTNAPTGRHGYVAVWTGSLMIVWGGDAHDIAGGGLYDPVSDAWTPMTTIGAPTPRHDHTAVWTGKVMVVWGGHNERGDDEVGGRYDPVTDTWAPTSLTNAPSRRYYHTAVWTGSLMVVWGGLIGDSIMDNGGRYDPANDNWTPTATTNAPPARYRHTAVWTGNLMVVWGGDHAGHGVNGGRYDPAIDTWTAMSTINAPCGGHAAVWTGSVMVVLGGNCDGSSAGGRYDPVADTWTPVTAADAPCGGQTAVWTGRVLIVWGGCGGSVDGGRYDPSTDTWTRIATAGAPTPRYPYTAVWTGSVMVVWGGRDAGGISNTGGRYDPATDSWIPTSTTNAPPAREYHTAVWTGAVMVVWGGWASPGPYVDVGGRYDPVNDTWSLTSTTDAPGGRVYHSVVWTGSRMIVWGGPGFTNTGGLYDPVRDRWTPTSTINAPTGRLAHTAVWTGNRMIVWGGEADRFYSDGGQYVPGSVDDDGDGRSECEGDCDDGSGPTWELSCPDPATLECPATGSDIGSAVVSRPCEPAPLVASDAPEVFPLGTTVVSWTATDTSGNSAVCRQSFLVRDTTAPTLTLSTEPDSLWPPNHDLVPVRVGWHVLDCDPRPAVVLMSVTSSEPDDVAGEGDGNTVDDIVGAVPGTSDGEFDLRAERDGSGSGRTYEILYRATDASGNTAAAFAVVTVPHDRGSGPEPLIIHLEPDAEPGSVRIRWSEVPDASGYDVISGRLVQVAVEDRQISLGAVTVLARGVTATSLIQGGDQAVPDPGSALFYLVRARTASGGAGYGTESAPWPRMPTACEGGCP